MTPTAQSGHSGRSADLIAGLSIAGLLLPEAVAYSGIANLPPQAGILALFAGLACYGLLGTSRYAIVSATSSSAAVLAAATASMAGADPALRLALAAGLVLLAGLYFLLAALARLGNVTDFISKPVLRGFAFGLAIVIVIKQGASFLGVHASGGNLLAFALDLLRQRPAWNTADIAVGLSALALLFGLSRLKRVPAGLIVIALGIAATRGFDLATHGVGLVGEIHLALRPPRIPELPRADWLRLAELGFAVVMILYSESYGSIRSFAIKHGDAVAPNRDLLALGVANLCSGLLAGLPVGAGYSATSANEAAGAVSRLAGAVAAAALLVLILTVLWAIALTPEPVLAAIVMHAVSHALDPRVFRPYFQWRRDRLVAVAAVAAVLWLGVLDGLLAAVAISLIMLLRRFSESKVVALGRLGRTHDFLSLETHPEAQPVPGLLILRPDEPLFFANAERILAQARAALSAAPPGTRALVLSLEDTIDLDTTTVEALQAFFAWAAANQRRVVLARLKHPVHELLKLAVAAGPAAPVMTGLSVDDAVTMALQESR